MNRIWNLITIIVFLFVSTSLFAGEMRLNSKLSLDYISFRTPYGSNTSNNIFGISILPDLSLTAESEWKYQFNPTIRWEPQNLSADEVLSVNPGEIFAKYKQDNFQFQIGTSFINWGITTLYNPLDYVNPRSYSNPLVEDRIGVFNFRSIWNTDWGALEFLYLPMNQKSKLPGSRSRWLPREIYLPPNALNNVILILPGELSYEYIDEKNNESLKNNFGLRMLFSGQTYDFSVQYYEGASTQPEVEPRVTGKIVSIDPQTVIEINPHVFLHTSTFKKRNLGSFISFNLPSYIFKLVSRYSDQPNGNIFSSRWQWESSIEIERTIQNFKSLALLNFIQFNQISTEKKDVSSLNFQNIFKKSILVGSKIISESGLSVTPGFLYDLETNSNILRLSLEKRTRENLIINLSAIEINGPSESPLGIFSKNDNLSFSILAYF